MRARPTRGAKRRDRKSARAHEADAGDEAAPSRRLKRRRRAGGKVDGKKAERRIDRRARGGGVQRLEFGGSPLGVSMGMADPYWTRRASYEMANTPRGTVGSDRAAVVATLPSSGVPVPAGIAGKLGSASLDLALRGYLRDIGPPPPHGRGIPRPEPPKPAVDNNIRPISQGDAIGLALAAKQSRDGGIGGYLGSGLSEDELNALTDQAQNAEIFGKVGGGSSTGSVYRRGGALVEGRARGGRLSEQAKFAWRSLPNDRKEALWARMGASARRAIQAAERYDTAHGGSVSVSGSSGGVSPHRRGGRLR